MAAVLLQSTCLRRSFSATNGYFVWFNCFVSCMSINATSLFSFLSSVPTQDSFSVHRIHSCIHVSRPNDRTIHSLTVRDIRTRGSRIGWNMAFEEHDHRSLDGGHDYPACLLDPACVVPYTSCNAAVNFMSDRSSFECRTLCFRRAGSLMWRPRPYRATFSFYRAGQTISRKSGPGFDRIAYPLVEYSMWYILKVPMLGQVRLLCLFVLDV